MSEKLGKYGRLQRRLEITEPQIEEVVRALRAGNRMPVACELAGVQYKTVADLQREASKAAVEYENGRITRHEEEILDIDRRLRRAMAEAEGRAVNTIARAVAENDWRAGAWFLQYARGWTKMDVQVSTDAAQVGGSWAATLKQALLGDSERTPVPKKSDDDAPEVIEAEVLTKAKT